MVRRLLSCLGAAALLCVTVCFCIGTAQHCDACIDVLDVILERLDLQVKFISETLAEYREIRKVYHYDYEPEDLKALQSCAKDLRPFTWSWVPAGITWYLSSKVVSTKGCVHHNYGSHKLFQLSTQTTVRNSSSCSSFPQPTVLNEFLPELQVVVTTHEFQDGATFPITNITICLVTRRGYFCRMSNAVRLTVGISRLMATWQVFRMGYLAGSYQQTTSCMKGLVSLPTPLGGEMVALIRSKNPEHPYLK